MAWPRPSLVPGIRVRTYGQTHALIAILVRRAVVDDRVHARVEIRQTVPQYAHRLHVRVTSSAHTRQS